MDEALRISFPGGARQSIEVLPPGDGAPVVFGRPTESGPAPDVPLPHPSVSRRHAEAAFRDGRWWLRSVGRAGTLVDQRPLPPGEWVPIAQGALVGIGPFLMKLGGGSSGAPAGVAPATIADDSALVRVQVVPAEMLERFAELRLSALLDASASIHGAGSATDVAEAAVAVAMGARDFERVAVVEERGPAGDPAWHVLAAAAANEDSRRAPLSRTLLAAARRSGAAVQLDQDPSFRAAVSMIGTQSALCVPLAAGADGPPRFLYADCRSGASPGPAAIAFANLVARLGGSAIDAIERRALLADLGQARQIQRRLLPADRGACAHVEWALFARPADTRVSGDYFAIAEGRDGRVAAILGDVAGKGPAAGLVMAAMVTHFDLSVRTGLPVEDAVSSASEFLAARPSLEVAVAAFTTAIAIEIHPDGSCRGVDAAHSYAAIVRADGRAEQLAFPSSSTMIGSFAGIRFEADRFRLGPGDRIVLFSDGVAEQRDPAGRRLAAQYHEDPAAVLAALEGSTGPEQDVARLRALVERHADGAGWDDDVTIASIALRA